MPTAKSQRLTLFEELDCRLALVAPEDYSTPLVHGIPKGTNVLGPATEEMKRLWTLFANLEREGGLGVNELLRRAAHVAISFEIGKHFDCWSARVGINSAWQVYAARSN